MRETDHLNQWNHLLGKDTVSLYETILKKIETERENGKEIFPAQNNIMRAINSVKPDNVKCVIIGQDPYHEPGQAMGLSFSVPADINIPPSLRNIFKELAADLNVEIPQSGDLSKWTEQGVLLLNTILTVEAHKAMSHQKIGWQAVTTAILQATIELPQPIVYICWGKQAERVIDSLINSSAIHKPYMVLRSTHPSPLSANNRKSDVPAFMGSRPFSKTNDFLRENAVKAINWAI